MSERIRFSIVMPVYGVEKYVAQAMDCILQQTYPAYELIMVDDCSKDRSKEVMEAVIQRYKNHSEKSKHQKGESQNRNQSESNPCICKILQQPENQGVSQARNRGLKEATGDYILFLDPDDYVDLQLLEVLARTIEKSRQKQSKMQSGVDISQDPDIIVYSLVEEYFQLDPRMRREQLKKQEDPKHLMGASPEKVFYTKVHRLDKQVHDCDTPEQIHEIVKDLERETMYGYPWNKAYNLAYLRKQCLHFKVIPHIEDILFNIKAFMEAQHVIVLPNVLYHYRNSGQSRLTSKYLPEYFALQKRRIQAFIDQQRSWNTLDQKALEIMANFYFRSFVSMMQREIQHLEAENESRRSHGGPKLSAKAIKEQVLQKCRQEMQTDLYRLLKSHVAKEGKVARILYQPIAQGKLEVTYQRVKVIGFVRQNFSGTFMRLKQFR